MEAELAHVVAEVVLGPLVVVLAPLVLLLPAAARQLQQLPVAVVAAGSCGSC